MQNMSPDLFFLCVILVIIAIFFISIVITVHIEKKIPTEEEYLNHLRENPEYPKCRPIVHVHMAPDSFFKEYDFVLEPGEIVAAQLENNVVKLKVGNGIDKYSDLPFV